MQEELCFNVPPLFTVAVWSNGKIEIEPHHEHIVFDDVEHMEDTFEHVIKMTKE